MKRLGFCLLIGFLTLSLGVAVFQIWKRTTLSADTSVSTEHIIYPKSELMPQGISKIIAPISADAKVFQKKGYSLKSEIGIDGARKNYIKRDKDKDWILFYIDYRAIFTTLGHQKRLILINDYEASKSSKVVVTDLTLHKATQIDLPAMKIYRRNVHPDKRLYINPDAHAFSPDDRQTLIEIKLSDVSASTEEESKQAIKTYKVRWYVVDSLSGRVLQEYRTNNIPQRWWVN